MSRTDDGTDAADEPPGAIPLRVPDREQFAAWADTGVGDLPRFAPARRSRDPPRVADVGAATVDALAGLDALEDLPPGSSVAVTAGSRGIHDLPAVLAAVVEDLQGRGLDPFVMPAMGSHGGATAEGQMELLASLGVTPERLGCEFRSSMAVERVGEGEEGRPVFAARDALAADAVLLVNRVKPHTDYDGDHESGLCKMAVVGLGKHRGAEAMHNAALARGFETVVPERAGILLRETPVVGGLALLDNAHDRAAAIEAVPADAIIEREPTLLERARELMATLPTADLDMLVVDEMGKNVSGTGLDTNVIGRVLFHGQPEPATPDVSRIYVRSVTDDSHGNVLGAGLADFVHRDVVAAADLADTYVNVLTSGEPVRAKLPFVVPADDAALRLAGSTTGCRDPADLRIARIENTLDPDRLLVSAPVARELRSEPAVEVGPLEPLSFDEGGRLATPLPAREGDEDGGGGD